MRGKDGKHPAVIDSKTEPVEPKKGTLWQDRSDQGRIKQFDGKQWVSLEPVPPRWRQYAPKDYADNYDKAVADPTALMSRVHKQMLYQWIEEQLWCPRCGHRVDIMNASEHRAEMDEIITLHGDGGIVEVYCEHCEEDFLATEEVRRTFQSHTIWHGICGVLRSTMDLDLNHYDDGSLTH
jgi:hypothetical protein